MEDIKTVLQIDFQGAESIGDLKAKVAQLKDELKACAAGSDEAADKAYELAKAENTLKAATKGAIDTTGKLAQSYNGLSSQMARLKIAQKNIDVSTKAGRKQYAEYAKEINKLNDKLKGLDASNGVFSRNVGDYANSIKSAMGGMGGAVTGVFTSINAGLKALVANPWVAVIAAIVLAIKELIDAVKRNEDAMEGVNMAFNKIKAAYVTLQRVFDAVVKAVLSSKGAFDSFKKWVADVWETVEPYATKVSNFFTTVFDYFTSFWDNVVKISIKAASYVKAGIQSVFSKKSFKELLDETQESWLQGWENIKDGVSNAVSNMVQSIKENYKEANDILDKITKAERALAELHIKTTTQIAQNNKKIAELNAKAADRENYTIKERKDALEEAAKLQKQNIELEIREAQERLRISKLKHALNADSNADLQEEADLQADIINLQAQRAEVERNLAQQRKTLDKELLKETKEALNAQKKAIEQELAETTKGSDERLRLTKDKLAVEKALEIADANEKIKDATKLAETLAKIEKTYNQKEVDAEVNHLHELADIRNQAASNDAARQKLEQGSNSLQYYQAELDAAKLYYENLYQLQGEGNAEFEARQIAALQKVKDAEQNLNNQRISNFAAVANGIADIMSTVASAWEDSIQRQVESGEISEEEGKRQFENVKAMQIAVATIQTITGAITAFMTAQQLGFPWGTIIGTIQAAAVTAAGIANIAKIKSTTLGSSASGGGSSGGGFALPSVQQYTPQYTQNLTGANDTADLSNAVKGAIEGADIKAYVVESDVTNAQKRANKRINESTW